MNSLVLFHPQAKMARCLTLIFTHLYFNVLRRSAYSIIIVFLGFLILISPLSCNFTGEKTKKENAALVQAKKDSLTLSYNEQNAHPELHEYMSRLHQRSGFNGNVLIAKNGKILYQNTMGWANQLMRDSLQITSRFELASVSKPLTATGVLKLWESGKLDLEQEMTDFFPDFPYPGVTVKQLLTHRSGLPNYIYMLDEVWAEKGVGVSNRDAVSLLISNKPERYSAPDRRFFYNNTNYMLLASIIEKVSGQDFAVYMQENIFEPAGMKHTAVYSKAVYDKIPTHVIGHDKVWRRSVVQNFLDGPVGDKGIYSTVQDLFLFDQALDEGRLLKKTTLDSAYQAYSKPDKGIFSYGLGWRTFDADGHKIVYHAGWWHGFKNLYVRDLENNITIVLLSNMANNSLLNLDRLYEILDMPVIRQAAYSHRGEYMGGN